MSNVKSAIRTMLICVPLFAATQAQSVSVKYSSDSIELIMLDPKAAPFGCAYNDLPAHIEINEDTRAAASIRFESSLFGFQAPPQELAEKRAEVTVRRGVDTMRVRVQKRPVGVDPKPARESIVRTALTQDEWHVVFTGQMKVCVGPGTLQVMAVDLDVLLQIGQYEGQIFITENTPEDLRLRYDIDLSKPKPQSLFRPQDEIAGRIVGNKQLGSTAPEDGRQLGTVRLFKQRVETNFTSPTDPEGFNEKTWLSVGFVLVSAKTGYK